MARDLREEILFMAKKLFNKDGFHNVSLRDIADELQISVGNLTYHFKKKNELVEAVIIEHHKGYRPPQIANTIYELNNLFVNICNHQKDNGYYFRNYTEFSQISAKVHDIQLKVAKNLYNALNQSFINLKNNGLMVQVVSYSQTEHLIQTVMIITVYWIPQSDLFNIYFKNPNQLGAVWNCIFPYLSETGKGEYKKTRNYTNS